MNLKNWKKASYNTKEIFGDTAKFERRYFGYDLTIEKRFLSFDKIQGKMNHYYIPIHGRVSMNHVAKASEAAAALIDYVDSLPSSRKLPNIDD